MKTREGQTIITGDQLSCDYTVSALLNTYQRGLPILLIADDKYKLFPHDLDKHTYAILGFYWIKYAWRLSLVCCALTGVNVIVSS